MKIDNSSKPVAPNTTGNTGGASRTRSPAAPATPNPAAAGSTEATLSGLQGLSSVLASTPAVDVERVAEIKQAIAEGRFKVNPERIADGLLQSVHEMLSGSR